MEADHLEIREKGMTAAERRVLICKFVAEANEEAMAKDESRVSCFRQCGVLLTLDGTGDELIKPQGCTKLPIKVPDLVDLALPFAYPIFCHFATFNTLPQILNKVLTYSISKH